MGAFQKTVGGAGVSQSFGWTDRCPRLGLIAVALAGLLAPAPAEAALFWSEPEPFAVVRPMRPPQPRRLKMRRNDKLSTIKEVAKPQGPLVIAISIQRQTVRVYDANGLYAESPVSTGMPGHSTPMGVFSVIQKDKWHRSNIYSNAPMPYMQRITWSGVAMHAGVLPGYPASHGCIRMPMAFAVKMWGWTRMGARVVITPGEIAPSDFTHPLLAFQKPAALPVAAALSAGPDAIRKTDKSLVAGLARTADASDSIQATSASKIAETAAPANPGSELRDSAGSAATSKDQGRPSDLDKPAIGPAVAPPEVKLDTAVAPAPSRRNGPIAVFISRKDSMLYVRQNFAPLFEAPVTIAPSDRPLGTHVFTARIDKDETGKDLKASHWSAVSLPVSRREERRDDSERAARHRKIASPIEMKPAPMPDTAAEALDRVSIPDDVIARISDALTTGASVIISDQGINSGETGEGTDFIVSLR